MNFSQNYDATIRAIEEKLGQLIDAGSDFDFSRSGDVLAIEFTDGEKIIVTPQAPMEQLWVSANYSGHRFNWIDEKWVNEKGGEEFFGFLSRIISEKIGDGVDLG
jgi:iron-sulfur cluster assembly protein CyaY